MILSSVIILQTMTVVITKSLIDNPPPPTINNNNTDLLLSDNNNIKLLDLTTLDKNKDLNGFPLFNSIIQETNTMLNAPTINNKPTINNIVQKFINNGTFTLSNLDLY